MRSVARWGLAAIAAAILGSFGSATQAANPTGTLRMQSNTTNFSSTFPEGNAGEFQITELTGDTASLAVQPAAFRAGGSFFQTFCMQINENIYSTFNYTWTLDTNFNGDVTKPLLPTTAYLFSQFWNGTLPSYNYTEGAGRKASATSLQLAMWYLQGEAALYPIFVDRYNNDAQAKAWVQQAQTNAGATIGDCRVLVMTEGTGTGTIARQDLLTMVPPPPKEECCGYKELTFKYTGPDCVKICAIDPAHTGGYYKTSLPYCTTIKTCTTFTVYAGDCWTSGKFGDDIKLVVKNKCGAVIECTTVSTDCDPKLVVGTVYGSFILTGFKEALCKPAPKCDTTGWSWWKLCIWIRDCQEAKERDWCGTRSWCDRGDLKDCADWDFLKDCKDFRDSDCNRSFRYCDYSWWKNSSWSWSSWSCR